MSTQRYRFTVRIRSAIRNRITHPLTQAWIARTAIKRADWKQHAQETYQAGLEERVDVAPPVHVQEIPSPLLEKQGNHVLPASEVGRFDEVYLLGPHAVGLTRHYRAILETTLGRTGCLLETTADTLKTQQRWDAAPIAHHKHVCSLVNLWSHNYFHWLLEALTRLEGLEHYSLVTGTRPQLLVGAEPPAWKIASLKLMGYDPADWIYWPGGLAKIEQLVVPAFRRKGGVTSPAACRWVRQRMVANLPEEEEATAYGKYIYISRANAKSRRVVNEAELMQVLHTYGFQQYKLEDLSMAAQIRLFQQADVVVAPHGAGLANIIFADELRVLELFGSLFNPCYYTLASALGHRYGFLKARPQDRDMYVELDVFEQALDALMS